MVVQMQSPTIEAPAPCRVTGWVADTSPEYVEVEPFNPVPVFGTDEEHGTHRVGYARLTRVAGHRMTVEAELFEPWPQLHPYLNVVPGVDGVPYGIGFELLLLGNAWEPRWGVPPLEVA